MTKKQKEVTRIVPFPVFDYKVILVITNDIIWSRGKRDAVIGHSLVEDNPERIDGLHSYGKGSVQSFVFLTPHIAKVGTISHECYHAICRMFRMVGVEHEEENLAYHLSYLCDEAVKAILKYDKKK